MFTSRCVVVIALFLVHLVSGYPTGAPDLPQACVDMLPTHGVEPQDTFAPYVVTVSENTYHPNTPITVTITGVRGTEFCGFILQMRQMVGSVLSDIAVGDFSHTSSAIRNTCETHGGRTVTHSNNAPKNSVSVQWTAADASAGPVVAVATVVQTRPVLWQKLLSHVLPVGSAEHVNLIHNNNMTQHRHQ
jgi:hypothetical protein